MNSIRPIITSFILILLTATCLSASQNKRAIAITIPNTLINEAIQKSLPLDFPIKSQTILGSLSIDAIKNMRLQKGKISSYIVLSGHNLNIVTSIAGHDLRAKLGSLTMGFQCDTSVRFDKKSQTLFIRPVATKLQSSNKAQTEIASTIAQLFNNQEFPLKLEKLRPILTDTGNKLLNISMLIETLDLQPGTAHLQITPRITTTPKQKTGFKTSSFESRSTIAAKKVVDYGQSRPK